MISETIDNIYIGDWSDAKEHKDEYEINYMNKYSNNKNCTILIDKIR